MLFIKLWKKNVNSQKTCKTFCHEREREKEGFPRCKFFFSFSKNFNTQFLIECTGKSIIWSLTSCRNSIYIFAHIKSDSTSCPSKIGLKTNRYKIVKIYHDTEFES